MKFVPLVSIVVLSSRLSSLVMLWVDSIKWMHIFQKVNQIVNVLAKYGLKLDL